MAEMTPTTGSPDEFTVGEPLILIYVSRQLANGLDAYEAVCRAWKINLNRAKNEDGSWKLVLARDGREVVGAFRPTEWHNDSELPGRKGFSGHPAEPSVWSQYVGKWTPAHFLPQGAQNPVRYFEPGD